MAILVDYNSIAYSTLFSQLNKKEIDERLVRHIIFNVIRSINYQFSGEFGEVYICFDSRHYWRKQIFPHYKASRKKKRQDDDVDWDSVFVVLNKVKDEVSEILPYYTLEVDTAEADDIIAVLAERLSRNEKVLIVSPDKDFFQLQKYQNVKQYSNVAKQYITSENPDSELYEKVMRGDKGDGVPNILSEDHALLEGERQKPFYKKYLSKFSDPTKMPAQVYERYLRNKKLIDFDEMPSELKSEIIEVINSVQRKGSMNVLFNFMVKNRMKNLLDKIDDFRPRGHNEPENQAVDP